jgi:hypothetical protein
MNGSYGIAIGLLRQEIDTFVRLVYLDAIGKRRAHQLIEEFAAGKRWTVLGSKKRITDREMVDVAAQRYFGVEIAYRFGCELIHLSKLHDYKSVDPFSVIDVEEQRVIVQFLHDYHGYPDGDIDFGRFSKLLPVVMNKISGKVAEYCCAVERAFA